MRSIFLGVTGAAMLATGVTWAHDGRRFEVKVVDGQLVAHGYDSAGNDDGAGAIRAYYNAIHAHWTNSVVGSGATATLPGFDVLDEASELAGYDLDYTLVGASKWTVTPDTGGHGGHSAMHAGGHDSMHDDGMHDGGHGSSPMIHLMPLSGEVIGLSYDGSVMTTDTPGAVELVDDWDGQVGSGNGFDLDFLYQIAEAPTDTLFVLEAVLSTDAPGVADSVKFYTILAPQGHGFHANALALEAYLGTPVPEPAVATLAAAGALALLRRRVA
ncbi:MAG: hypothetical protein AAF823_12215 [Planctomycetota bacterium]